MAKVLGIPPGRGDSAEKVRVSIEDKATFMTGVTASESRVPHRMREELLTAICAARPLVAGELPQLRKYIKEYRSLRGRRAGGARSV